VQTHWPRDWGPHQVFDGNGQWGIVDPIFEGYPWVGAGMRADQLARRLRGR
jgi:hypothetical protein